MNINLQYLIIKVSKTLLYGLFLQCFFFSFLLAEKGSAQGKNLDKTFLNIEKQVWPLQEIIGEIERNTEFHFVYPDEFLASNTEVKLPLRKTSVKKILLAASRDAGLKFHQINNAIYIGKTEVELKTNISENAPQPITVSGKVTSAEDPAGLPGVNVLIKNSTQGTVTDINGEYRIEVPNTQSIIVFSSIGFTSEEVVVGDRSTIDFIMTPDIRSLNEVVVVGYGVQKKETVTGSVATVKGEELIKSPAMNLSNSIAGRIPGVIAVNRSGEPGYDGSGIRIRGSNTLGNNDALIVIDGIPARAGGFERLNPADIESISVLKDASAAIYGSRAANGVILVTTRRGQTGKPEISYSFNQGFAQPTVIPKLANSTQYAEMRNDLEIYNLPVNEWAAAQSAFRETGSYTGPGGNEMNAPYGPEDFEKFRDGSDPWFHPNTNWYDATLKTWSPQSRHNLQLSGGSENFKYMTSLGYQNQDAFYKNSATGYKQYDLRINLDANINKYVKTTLGVLGRQENRFFPTVGAGAIFRMQMRGIPTSPAFWPNGKPGPDIENGENPVVITTNQTGYDRDTRYYLQSNGQVEISNPWIEGLKVIGTASIDKYIRNTKRWRIPWFLYTHQGNFEDDGTPIVIPGKRGPAEPELGMGTEDQLNMLLGAMITYDKKFGEHSFNFLAGTNKETIQNSNFGAYRRYFISPVVDQMFAGGDEERNNSGGAFERARLNYFGRVAYNFQEKYLAEFLWRFDGSYMFPENSRYGFFPGVMLGWQISEESFFKDNVSFMNYLKLRGSWGQMGNDNITYGPDGPLMEYQFLSTYGFNDYIIGGRQAKTLFETRVPNNQITWEVANNANIGLEGSLLDGKVSFEFDFFYNKRTNILWPQYGSIPQSTGMTLPPQNLGEVANKGFDALISYNNRVGDFRYNVSVNGGYAKNEVLFWDEAPGAPEWQRTTGRPMYTYQAYIYNGVFRDQADIDANTLDYSAITNTVRPGDMKFKDYDGDGAITPDDQVRNDKNITPTFQGGLNIGMQFKNFDLAILFQGAAGAQVYVSTGEMGSIGNYLEDIYENRWTLDNPSSEHPRISDRGNQYFSSNNTYWLRSTDYIRLKNFELGYTIPAGIVERIGISHLRVYVNGLNLFHIDKLGVYDPENASPSGQYYPQSRILNTGLTVSF
ncbi:MAG: TonB-dependent receptor [Bacteroidota bacterium]|nr:TonB-dependent receptor [Bacteroidota bacterium]